MTTAHGDAMGLYVTGLWPLDVESSQSPAFVTMAHVEGIAVSFPFLPRHPLVLVVPKVVVAGTEIFTPAYI